MAAPVHDIEIQNFGRILRYRRASVNCEVNTHRRSAMRRLKQSWLRYRYRFLPWILKNLDSKSQILAHDNSAILSNSEAVSDLQNYYQILENANPFQPEQLKPSQELLSKICLQNRELTYDHLGFCIERLTSKVDKTGKGILVTKGKIPKHKTAALYPGTVYYPEEPILLQSIGNKFIFKCSDSSLIDGNDRGLSKLVYKSLSERDRIGFHRICDRTWLTTTPWNILAVGQYVNNQNKEHKANVMYQEVDLPSNFPLELLRYHCNVSYGEMKFGFKTVVLVTLRDIHEGEELLSTYHTIIR